MAAKEFNKRCREIRKQITAETTDFERIAREYEKAINDYIRRTGQRPPYRKRPDESRGHYRAYNLDWIAESLDKIIENIERKRQAEANRNRTREEWAEWEKEFIRARQNRDDFEDLLFELYLEDEITFDEYEKALESARECACWCCGNWFVPGMMGRRADAKYCSRRCAEEQRNAEIRFRRSAKRFKAGTYLPVKVYEPNRREYEERKYYTEIWPTLTDPNTLDQIVTERYDGRTTKSKRAAAASYDGSGEGHSVNVRLSEEVEKIFSGEEGESVLKDAVYGEEGNTHPLPLAAEDGRPGNRPGPAAFFICL